MLKYTSLEFFQHVFSLLAICVILLNFNRIVSIIFFKFNFYVKSVKVAWVQKTFQIQRLFGREENLLRLKAARLKAVEFFEMFWAASLFYLWFVMERLVFSFWFLINLLNSGIWLVVDFLDDSVERIKKPIRDYVYAQFQKGVSYTLKKLFEAYQAGKLIAAFTMYSMAFYGERKYWCGVFFLLIRHATGVYSLVITNTAILFLWIGVGHSVDSSRCWPVFVQSFICKKGEFDPGSE